MADAPLTDEQRREIAEDLGVSVGDLPMLGIESNRRRKAERRRERSMRDNPFGGR